MASLSELLAARQNDANSLAAPVIPKTKLEEKKERLFGENGKTVAGLTEPAVPSTDESSLLQYMSSGASGEDASLVDLGQSSMYRAGGSLADMGKSISNAVLDTEFDDSVETGWSRQADPEQGVASAADQMAGVSFDQRQNENEQLQGVMNDWVEGDYLGALGGALQAAPGVIADSAASGVELAAGAALTPVAGAGTALLGKKAKNIYDIIGKIGDSYDVAKDAQRAAKAEHLLSKAVSGAAKGSSQASILTADIVQQTKTEYEQETSEEMSPERLFGTTALTLATTAWQPKIVSKFYMPKLRTPAGKTAKAKFDSEVKRMVEYADRGLARSIAGRIGAGAGKVFQAGGAEAVQEYAQTWAGILSVHMDPEEAGGLFQAAYKEFADDDNQNEAEVAGLLGAGAGGGIKTAVSAPGVATGAATDVGVKTAQYAGKKAQNAARVNLSEQDQARLDDEIAGMKAADTEIREEKSRKAAIVGKSESFDQVSDEAVRADFTNAAKGRDLSDPKVFSAISNGLVRSYKKDSFNSAVSTKAKSGYETGKAKTKQVVEDLPISDKTKAAVAKKAREVVQGTKDLSEAFVEDISNFKTSATLGVAEATVDFVAETTKTGSKKASNSKAVKDLRARVSKAGGTAETARTVAGKIADSAPLAARELNRWADGQEASRKKTGLKTDTLVNYESLGDSIKQASQASTKVTNPLALAQDLRSAVKGTVEDLDTVRAVENALDNYEDSNFKGDGKLSPAWIKNVRRDMSGRRSELEAKVSRVDQAKETASKVGNTVKEKTAPAVDKAKSVTAAGLESIVDRITNEDVFVSEDTPAQRKVLGKLMDRVKSELDQELTEEEIKLADPEKVALARANSVMKIVQDNPAVLKGLSKAFKTSNPEYLASIVERVFPLARKEGIGDNLMGYINKALEDSEQPNTKPERQRKTTKKSDDTAADGEVVVEEDGAVFKRKPDIAEAKTAMEKLIGSINICKV